MNIKELIIHNSETGSTSMFNPFMFSNISSWKDKPLSFWEDILDEIRNKPLSLYLYLPFVYKFLGIDMIPKFLGYDDISESTSDYMRDSLDEKSHWLYFFPSDVGMINDTDKVIFEEFVVVKKKLVAQGAIPVNTIILSCDVPIKVNRDYFLLGLFEC